MVVALLRKFGIIRKLSFFPTFQIINEKKIKTVRSLVNNVNIRIVNYKELPNKRIIQSK
jgi:hypothetical protein